MSAVLPCPCGGNDEASNCCVVSGGKHWVEQAVTRRAGKPSLYENPRCYARAHRQCSQRISREHFMSESLLRELMGTNDVLQVQGMAHQTRGEYQSLRAGNLASKILCEACNTALSPLDDLVARARRHLRTAPSPSLLVLNGHDVERWILKLLCGHAASATARHPKTGTLRQWTPPTMWLDILYGDMPFKEPLGLYALPGPREEFSFELFSDNGRPIRWIPREDHRCQARNRQDHRGRVHRRTTRFPQQSCARSSSPCVLPKKLTGRNDP